MWVTHWITDAATKKDILYVEFLNSEVLQGFIICCLVVFSINMKKELLTKW